MVAALEVLGLQPGGIGLQVHLHDGERDEGADEQPLPLAEGRGSEDLAEVLLEIDELTHLRQVVGGKLHREREPMREAPAPRAAALGPAVPRGEAAHRLGRELGE